jgi:hypothetical protein
MLFNRIPPSLAEALLEKVNEENNVKEDDVEMQEVEPPAPVVAVDSWATKAVELHGKNVAKQQDVEEVIDEPDEPVISTSTTTEQQQQQPAVEDEMHVDTVAPEPTTTTTTIAPITEAAKVWQLGMIEKTEMSWIFPTAWKLLELWMPWDSNFQGEAATTMTISEQQQPKTPSLPLFMSMPMENSSNPQQSEAEELSDDFPIAYVRETIGCETCAKHLDEYLPSHPRSVGTSKGKWLFDLHNAVNVRLGKQTIDEATARKQWTNIASLSDGDRSRLQSYCEWANFQFYTRKSLATSANTNTPTATTPLHSFSTLTNVHDVLATPQANAWLEQEANNFLKQLNEQGKSVSALRTLHQLQNPLTSSSTAPNQDQAEDALEKETFDAKYENNWHLPFSAYFACKEHEYKDVLKKYGKVRTEDENPKLVTPMTQVTNLAKRRRILGEGLKLPNEVVESVRLHLRRIRDYKCNVVAIFDAYVTTNAKEKSAMYNVPFGVVVTNFALHKSVEVLILPPCDAGDNCKLFTRTSDCHSMCLWTATANHYLIDLENETIRLCRCYNDTEHIPHCWGYHAVKKHYNALSKPKVRGLSGWVLEHLGSIYAWWGGLFASDDRSSVFHFLSSVLYEHQQCSAGGLFDFVTLKIDKSRHPGTLLHEYRYHVVAEDNTPNNGSPEFKVNSRGFESVDQLNNFTKEVGMLEMFKLPNLVVWNVADRSFDIQLLTRSDGYMTLSNSYGKLVRQNNKADYSMLFGYTVLYDDWISGETGNSNNNVNDDPLCLNCWVVNNDDLPQTTENAEDEQAVTATAATDEPQPPVVVPKKRRNLAETISSMFGHA